jgi:protoporphyrinogen oxidase
MKIAIIGAGFGGMAAAWDLRRAGHGVVIYEAADFVGGLASGFKEPHWESSVEKFYHHWFASDKEMLKLMDELGVREQVIFPRPYTVIYHQGRFYPFDSMFSNIPLFILRFYPLQIFRIGLVGLYLRLTNNWHALEKHTADQWMLRYAGETIYNRMWKPLLVSKFSEQYFSQVNMAWLWARLKARTTRLGTFEGGFQAFADLFAARLREMGVEIRLGAKVESITAGAASGDPGAPNAILTVESDTGEEVYDQALVTTSPALMARLCPELPEDYLKGLLELKSMGAVVMVAALKHALSEQGFYWFNLPKEEGFPMLALVEHTNFVPADKFGGDHIIYAGDYLVPGHEYFSLSETELLERFSPAFKRINPAFEPDWVRKVWVFKTAYAQPVPLVNHSRNIPPIETPIKGLYFASMSQVYPWDRGTNFAVEIGRRAARLMMEA